MTPLDSFASVLFWAGGGALVYVYVGYPLLVRLLASLSNHGVSDDRPAPPTPPHLTVLLAVHNEEECIGRRLVNLLEQAYDPARFDIIVSSDGSTDRTADIVRAFAMRAPITLVDNPRGGKSAAQNAALAQIAGDIVVFTDVRTCFAPDFLHQISRPFRDPRIGCVTGGLSFADPGRSHAQGQGLHWRQELATRAAESRLGILAVASGPAMAVRREVFEPIPEHVGEDCVLPLMAIKGGLRVVQCPQAKALDELPADSRSELRARARMVVRNWQGTWLFPGLLNPLRQPGVAWSLWSHKLLKWLSPAWLLLTTAAGLWLVAYPLYSVLVGALLAAYLAAMVGFVGDRLGVRLPIASLAFSFGLANVGFFLGLWQVLCRRRIVVYGATAQPVR